MTQPRARLLLVRHGVTDWNRAKRAQGTADVDLNDEGRRQAAVVARELASFDLAAIYASDLKRALSTARPIAEAHGLEVVPEPRFREVDQGAWTGLTPEEISERWPELWRARRFSSARPGGESPAQVRARMVAGIDGVLQAHPEGSVVVVSHGAAIRWLSAHALGLREADAARVRGLDNAGIVSITGYRDGGRVVLGDLHRLDGRTPDLDDPNA